MLLRGATSGSFIKVYFSAVQSIRDGFGSCQHIQHSKFKIQHLLILFHVQIIRTEGIFFGLVGGDDEAAAANVLF